MDVYLIPVGDDEYALYSNVPPAEVHEDGPVPTGFLGRVRTRIRHFLARVEREDVSGPEGAGTAWAGWRERMRRSLARRIGEQRLLWRLRGLTAATIVRPDDCTDALAVELVRAQLRRDADRHRIWLVVDGLAFIVSGLLALVPGPNLVAYYFAFSAVGHYLSMRGARHGRAHVQWGARGEAALSDLRRALGLPAADRDRRLHEIADRLHLPALPEFVTRAALRSA